MVPYNRHKRRGGPAGRLSRSAQQFIFSTGKMNIEQVYSFRVEIHGQDKIVHLRRNYFAQDPMSQAFVYEQRNRKNDIINSFFVSESTAQLSLDHALELQQESNNLISVEVEKFS